MEKFESLYKFIESATKSRKYAENTASGLKAALKLFEAEINDDERESVEKFKNNLEQIYHNVFSKNSSKLSAASLATYKGRVMKVIDDFEEYGQDPAKMANWNPSRRIRSQNQTLKPQLKNNKDNQVTETEVLTNRHRIDLNLRPGIRFTIDIPEDTSKDEIEKIKSILDRLIS
ncbi:MAG: hypothetical protein WC508_03740 [Patescibacteria group bacterium]